MGFVLPSDSRPGRGCAGDTGGKHLLAGDRRRRPARHSGLLRVRLV